MNKAINNEKLRAEYAQTALEWMNTMTEKGGDINGLNMVFCEQKTFLLPQ